jgi:hypothetical protein
MCKGTTVHAFDLWKCKWVWEQRVPAKGSSCKLGSRVGADPQQKHVTRGNKEEVTDPTYEIYAWRHEPVGR